MHQEKKEISTKKFLQLKIPSTKNRKKIMDLSPKKNNGFITKKKIINK